MKVLAFVQLSPGGLSALCCWSLLTPPSALTQVVGPADLTRVLPAPQPLLRRPLSPILASAECLVLLLTPPAAGLALLGEGLAALHWNKPTIASPAGSQGFHPQ